MQPLFSAVCAENIHEPVENENRGQRSACDGKFSIGYDIFKSHSLLPENVLITKELDELEATGQENQHTLRPEVKYPV